MTPAEIRDIADAVEVCTATNEQVALALGWICERPRTRTRHGLWRGPCDPPSAYHSKDPPSFTTSLDALAAECARREWACSLGQNVHHRYWHASLNRLDAQGAPETFGCSDASTPAAALCAALLRAVAAEKEATGE